MGEELSGQNAADEGKTQLIGVTSQYRLLICIDFLHKPRWMTSLPWHQASYCDLYLRQRAVTPQAMPNMHNEPEQKSAKQQKTVEEPNASRTRLLVSGIRQITMFRIRKGIEIQNRIRDSEMSNLV